MLKRLGRILLIILLLSMLSGCWDFEDINKKSFILSVGVDRIDGNIEIIGEATAFKSVSGEKEKAKAQGFFIGKGRGKDIEKAKSDINRQTSYEFYLGDARTVIFGQNYAKEGIEPYINRIDNLLDFRKTVIPVVSLQTPRELFGIKIENDIGLGLFIENNLKNLKSSGKTYYTTIPDILNNIGMRNKGYLLPFIKIDNSTIKLSGFAVMKNSKMIGIIDIIRDVEVYRGSVYIMNRKASFFENIEMKGKNTYVFTTKIKSKSIKTNYKNGKIIINLNLDIIASLNYQYHIQSIDDNLRKKLEKDLTDNLKGYITKSIERTQKEYETDIYYLASNFRAENFDVFKKIDWEKEYPKAEIKANVKVKIVNEDKKDYRPSK